MAIEVIPFYAIVLRPFVDRRIAQHGWKQIVKWASMGLFDGEILALGAMNYGDIEDWVKFLEEVGYNGPTKADEADFAIFSPSTDAMPGWLECVEVRLLDDLKTNVHAYAWKMKNSEVYELHDFRHSHEFLTKGYEVDWPPYIGKIS